MPPFQDGVGAMVMGRESFEKVLTFPDWPYKDAGRSPEPNARKGDGALKR